MTITDEQYAALLCAVNVLQGTAGGYTEREKRAARKVLNDMLIGATIAFGVVAARGK